MAQADLRQIEPVSDYLFGAEIYRGIKEVVTRYELPTERVAEFLDLIDAVVAGTIELVHMPEIVAEAFGIDAEKAQKVTCDLAGTCILPLERYMPGVRAQVEAWGGKIADFPEYRVPKEQFTVDQYAGRLTETHALTLSPQFIKRLGFLVKSYVEGVKSHDAILGFFQRPVAIGGLGLATDVAEKILADVSTQKDTIEFAEATVEVAPEAPAVVVPAEPVFLPEVAPSHEVATTTPVIVGEALRTPAPVEAPKPPVLKPEERHADGEEIAQHEKTIAKKGMVGGEDLPLEAAVKTAVDAAAATLAIKRIAKKDFADMARLTIKGVRDPYQTRAVLERDCGVTGEELVQLLEAIMLGLEEYHARPAEVAAPALMPPMPPSAPVAPVVTAEQHALDTRFAAVAGKLPTETIEPVMPSARVSAARTKDEEVAAQIIAVDETKLAHAAAASKPEPANAMLTVGSVPPPQAGEQKVMNDVQFRPKLVGPVEELGLMTPTEFRRLSSNPADAAKKVDDVLTNLESTSYEDRIRGVQAWRKSPINVLYAQMAAEALREGVALAEIASRRRNKGQESLSPAEMKAIASINARIQF